MFTGDTQRITVIVDDPRPGERVTMVESTERKGKPKGKGRLHPIERIRSLGLKLGSDAKTLSFCVTRHCRGRHRYVYFYGYLSTPNTPFIS